MLFCVLYSNSSLHPCPAPSRPLNVMAAAASSTSISVQWDPPLIFNGIIRNYEITYYRTSVGISDSQTYNTMEGVAMATNVTGLEIYTNYTLFVRARTVALGNESETVTVVTEEDRKFVNYRNIPTYKFEPATCKSTVKLPCPTIFAVRMHKFI